MTFYSIADLLMFGLFVIFYLGTSRHSYKGAHRV